jgi:anthranilate phosphoribosyltransferase
MREVMQKISARFPVVVDTCGTGGDGKQTFNISTAAAFVAAGAGLSVAKHGNRSISSRCGSADVLEALGVKTDMSKETAERCLNTIGMTFLFAPLYHPAMKHVAGIRKELGIRTIFNLLGPLLNPASANAQVIGVPRKELIPLISKVLQKLNHGKPSCAMVVHESGHDELVLSGKADGAEIFKNKIRAVSLTPKTFGLKKIRSSLLNGGDAAQNAQILKDLLTRYDHPLRDIVVANAALAMVCAQRVQGLVGAGFMPASQVLGNAPIKGAATRSIKDAVQLARESILSGAALKKLNDLAECSHS